MCSVVDFIESLSFLLYFLCVSNSLEGCCEHILSI